MINAALAAEAGGQAETAFYAAPTFWVAIAFLIVIGGALRPLARGIAGALDLRTQRIRDQIEEAHRLHDEAQQMLATYQRKQRDAAKEAEEIVASAEAEAERLAREQREQLETSLKRREQQAMDRLRQAEQQAVADVRDQAVEIAMAAARRAITDTLSAQKQNALIDKAIDELPRKLH